MRKKYFPEGNEGTLTGVLDGQVAVITGAGEGIGRGVALELARAGADICVNDIRDPEEVQPLLAELESLGVRALYVQTDGTPGA